MGSVPPTITGKDPGRAQPLVQGAVKPSRKVVLGKENELRVVRHAHETDNCEIWGVQTCAKTAGKPTTALWTLRSTNRGVLAFQGIIDSEHCCETLAIVAIVLRKSSLTQHKLMITPKIVHLINQPQGNMAITAVKRLTHYYIEKLDKRIKQTVVQIHLNMALQWKMSTCGYPQGNLFVPVLSLWMESVCLHVSKSVQSSSCHHTPKSASIITTAYN